MTPTTLRTRVRDSAFRLIRAAGGMAVASHSRWRARRLLILCYHGFAQADEDEWHGSLYIPARHLEARLRFLANEGYVAVSLAEGLRRMAAGTLPPRAVAFTVDDGSYDFYAVGYPVFQRAGVPVTVYVTTYYVFDQKPVFDVACAYLLWKGRGSGVTSIPAPGGGEPLVLGTEHDRDRTHLRVHGAVRRLGWTADQKHQWLGELATRLGLDWRDFLARRMISLMNPGEVGSLDPAIANVQLHGHRHRLPGERASFLKEIADNRRALAECGVDPAGLKHFCYPSGVPGPENLSWLAEAGVVSAVTGSPGLASPNHHPLLLPRFIDASTTSEVEFEGWISGIRHLLRKPAPRTRAAE